MCGIVGLIAPSSSTYGDRFAEAVDALAHRGPDGRGVVRHELTAGRALWLGHRRLAVIDLDPRASQPMQRGGGTLVFNGEIYDHRALRDELRAEHDFGTESDTEVLLAGLDAQGPAWVSRLNGMFAFAHASRDLATLLLGRDRLGKKPLYVYRAGEVLAWASELKSFVAMGLPLTLDPESLAFFRWLGYVPAERAIYRECRKLGAGTLWSVDLRDPALATRTHRYWDPLHAVGRRYAGSYAEALDEVGALLDDAVRLRLAADVPVGAFLSGGIDSTLVVSSLARLHASGVRSFTVAPSDPALDESPVALETARQLGVPATVLPLEEAAYGAQIERLPWHYDEPFADSSQIPTMAISELARRHVTVVLSGDGGDELFLGYPWVSHPARMFRYRRLVRAVPGASAAARAALGTAVGMGAFRALVRALGLNAENLEVKRAIVGELLEASRPCDVYHVFHELAPRAFLGPEDRAVVEGRSLRQWAERWYPDLAWEALEERSDEEQNGVLDLLTYLRDDILVKVDRGTMAYALEARAPFLDYRLVELALSLPLSFKIREGRHKALLRDLVERRIGPRVSRLGKRGFGIPLPASLPPGPSTPARWSRFVEAAWRERYGAR